MKTVASSTRARLLFLATAVSISVSAAIAGATTATSGAGSATRVRHTGSTVAVGASKWAQLTKGRIGDLESIGVHRFGRQLQLVWVQPIHDKDALWTAIVGNDGKPIMKPERLLTWLELNSYPSLYANDGIRYLSFSGLQNDESGNTYSQGYQYQLASDNGRSWHLTDLSLSSSGTAYGSDGSDTTTMANGAQVQVYTALSSQFVSYHVDAEMIPSTASDDPTTGNTGNFAYDDGVARDLKKDTATTVWVSDTSKYKYAGVDAQQIVPSLGPLLHAPDSDVRSGGQGESVVASERIRVAARVGGGVYAAYGEGVPDVKKIALWRVGAVKAMTEKVPSHLDDPHEVAIAGTTGRVWLAWAPDVSGSTGDIKVARTNATGTRLGATCTIAPPGKDFDTDDLTGDGGSGGLNLIAFGSIGNQSPEIYSSTVLPCMSVKVSPRTISGSRGGKVTVTVSDAGSPIKGAEVDLLGQESKTDKHGRATLKVSKGAKRGKHVVAVKAAGYQSSGVTISVS